jgi:hypothetical protein
MNIAGLRLPEFFFRNSSVSGKLDFLPSLDNASCDSPEKAYYIRNHCNGLVLLNTYNCSEGAIYVVNPATKRWDLLPSCQPDRTTGVIRCISDYKWTLAFDPMVSSHYHVLRIPYFILFKDAPLGGEVFCSTRRCCRNCCQGLSLFKATPLCLLARITLHALPN